MIKDKIIHDICLEILNDRNTFINASLILDVIERLEKHGFKFGDDEKLKPVTSEKYIILDDDVFEFLCSHLNIITFGGGSPNHFTLGNKDSNHRTFYKRSLGLLTFEKAQTRTQEPSEPVLDVLTRVLRSFGIYDPYSCAKECYKALYVASYRIVDKP